MKFIFSLTRREIRSSWRRLLFFFLCIALGVGSVVALRSLIQNLTRAVGTDARALMTADLEVSSTNDFAPQEIEKIDAVINASGIVEARNEAITTALMTRPSDPVNQTVDFVELKGIEPSKRRAYRQDDRSPTHCHPQEWECRQAEHIRMLLSRRSLQKSYRFPRCLR